MDSICSIVLASNGLEQMYIYVISAFSEALATAT